MKENERNIVWHHPSVTVTDRRQLYDYKSCEIWFTGLPSAGKSTIANALSKKLHSVGIMNYVLDGDNIRHGLNKNLGFSPEDRKENIRRIGEVAALFVDAGLIVMTAFISPYREDRNEARAIVKEGDFIEVYVKCRLEECERRDPKGMYKKAKAGQIKEFTGISAAYEEPEKPEIILETDQLSIEACVEHLLDYLVKHKYIKPFRLEKEAVSSHASNSYSPAIG
jgi:adenylylsulfate kinase